MNSCGLNCNQANLAQYAIFTNVFHKYDLLASFIGIQEEKWTKLGMYEAN